jgi:hypothetical protein
MKNAGATLRRILLFYYQEVIITYLILRSKLTIL